MGAIFYHDHFVDVDLLRFLDVRVASTVDQVRSLASVDPSWETEVHFLAGGWLVLSGAGMYVNRAMGAGIETGLTPADLEFLVTRSQRVGVVPSFEVTPSTHQDTVDLLRTRGFAIDASQSVSVLMRSVDGPPIAGPSDMNVHPVRSEAGLRLWQTTTALGWGHTTPEARRASDAFAAAVAALDNEHLVVALDATDGRPVGCASTTILDGVAIFGGMSTVPAERRRGIQAALLRYRHQHAARNGCDLAATTAAVGGASESNLLRHGFAHKMEIATFTL